MTLCNYTLGQLKEEIEKRNEILNIQQVKEPDFTELTVLCQKYIDGIGTNSSVPGIERLIFGEAMIAVFGLDVLVSRSG